MNNEKQTLKLALQKHYAKKSLSNTQLSTLQEKLKDNYNTVEPRNTRFTTRNTRFTNRSEFKWLSSAAVALLFFVALTSYIKTPDIITLAYADILKDSELNNGIQPTMQQWLNENSVTQVPQQYPVEMSKFCLLDKYLTAHLRIAGIEQGKMNVFFHQGPHGLNSLKRSGTMNNMNWKLLKVRDDLTIIVMYTQDMREQAVQHILRNILPELVA